MLRTLFVIPHEILGIPLFGFGWALLVWAVVSALILLQALRREGWSPETRGTAVTSLILGALLMWVLPWLEARVNGQPVGLAVRGYGALVLLGTVAGVALAVYRARRIGWDAELIFSLAVWMFVLGFGGGRLFFIIQYWDSFRRPTWTATLSQMARFTEGGLVVYGAFFGGLLALALFARQRRISALALADLIAPSLLIGLALGRIGCLMNGCCYGAVCPPGPLAIRFPSGSPPYVEQLEQGRFQGLQLQEGPGGAFRVVQVAAGSAAEASGITPGAVLKSVNGVPLAATSQAMRIELLGQPSIAVETVEGQVFRWSVGQLPARSLPVQPAQIYSSVGAALLCLVTLTFYPFRRRDGDVLALLLVLYALTRFLEELIRVDEPGRFGTSLSIGQWVSVGVFAAGVLLGVSRRAGC